MRTLVFKSDKKWFVCETGMIDFVKLKMWSF